jgi:thiamine-monophosphate kinase
MTPMHEFEFVDWVRRLFDRPECRAAVPAGIGDDMAVLDVNGTRLLLGSDMTIEGIHFDFSTATPAQVGHKALGRCLSDCAAMAGVPVAAIISAAKPGSMADKIFKEVFCGLAALANRFNCPVVGGDTSTSPGGLVIDVCLLGKCEGNEPVLRAGARPGDFLYVTGPLGGSILGKHLAFEPQIDLARWLVRRLPVHAMIDITDGLSGDLGHVCEESGCGAQLPVADLDAVVAPAARTAALNSGKTPLEHALNDGEDFELLLAAPLPPDQLPALPDPWRLLPVGRIVDGRGVQLLYPDGRQLPLAPGGFRHF